MLCNLWSLGKCVSTRLRKLRAMFGLNVFAQRGVKPNDIALSIPAGLLCYMWHAFKVMCKVAVCPNTV